jgi:L,D-peptidoglycan transpeptidase YkuD (ErfK/YbiS/YcfS/YnhG family)
MASSPPRPNRSRDFTTASYIVKSARMVVVRRSACERSKGRLEVMGLVLRCALGKGGVSAFKREGDGASPRGRCPLRRVWIRRDRRQPPVGGLPVRLTTQGDGWCDDTRHPRYNRPVRLPFGASHERMWRDDGLYDVVVEIGWNDRPVIPGRGSAIFLHLARPGYMPTEGCVAVSVRDMARLLPRLGPRTRIEIA